MNRSRSSVYLLALALSAGLLAGCNGSSAVFVDNQFVQCSPTGAGTGNRFPASGQNVGSNAIRVYVTEPLSDHYPINCVQTGDPFLLIAGIQALFPARSLAIFDPTDAIDSAVQSVRIAVPDIKSRSDVVAALLAAIGRGVIVEIVVEDFFRNENAATFNTLTAAGAVVKTDANDLNLRVNSNYMVIDSIKVFFSSGNFLSNDFFTTSSVTVEINDVVIAACFLGDFNQMVSQNRFQSNKLATAAKCEGVIVDGKYGVDVYFGPHSNQIRDEMQNLFNETDFSLRWGNSSLSDLTVAGALSSLTGSVLGNVVGVVNGADQNGGTFLTSLNIFCFSDPNSCTHADLAGQSGVGVDFIGDGLFAMRGHNLRYFVGDAESTSFEPYFALTSANMTDQGLTKNDEALVVIRDLDIAQFGAFQMHARALRGTTLTDALFTVQEPALAFVAGTVAMKNDEHPLGDNLPESATVTISGAGFQASSTDVELEGGAGTVPFSAFVPVGGVVTVQIVADGYQTITVNGLLMGPGVWDMGHFRPERDSNFQAGGGPGGGGGAGGGGV